MVSIALKTFAAIQLLSHVWLFFVTPWTTAHQHTIFHHLPEFVQTHVHWVSESIQPPHPLSSPSPALDLSQHQGLFQWVDPLHQVAKVLELQLQHQSFTMNIQDWFPLGLTGLFSLPSKGLSRVFSCPEPVRETSPVTRSGFKVLARKGVRTSGGFSAPPSTPRPPSFHLLMLGILLYSLKTSLTLT